MHRLKTEPLFYADVVNAPNISGRHKESILAMDITAVMSAPLRLGLTGVHVARVDTTDPDAILFLSRRS
jgi:hypothetical protein